MVAAALPLAQDGDWHHMDWDSGWWILMVAGMVLFWGLVIVGVVWAVHELTRRRDRPSAPSPLDVLDHRLASGEITPDDYEKRRRLIGEAQRQP
jgi:putative membrane protein